MSEEFKVGDTLVFKDNFCRDVYLNESSENREYYVEIYNHGFIVDGIDEGLILSREEFVLCADTHGHLVEVKTEKPDREKGGPIKLVVNNAKTVVTKAAAVARLHELAMHQDVDTIVSGIATEAHDLVIECAAVAIIELFDIKEEDLK